MMRERISVPMMTREMRFEVVEEERDAALFSSEEREC